MNQHKKINWSKYNKSLINRGSITFWLDPALFKNLSKKKKQRKVGRPFMYSDELIKVCLIVKCIYSLTYRSLEGFLKSLLSFANFDQEMQIPSYTQIHKRGKRMKYKLEIKNVKKATDIVVDSSGVKVYGEGEWVKEKHGSTRKKQWKKFHIGIDPETQDIILAEKTDPRESDVKVAERWMKNWRGEGKKFYGDGAYDSKKLRQKIEEKQGYPLIPPRKNSRYGFEGSVRDDQIAAMIGLGGGEAGRELWKKLTGYHQRSLVESAFSRFKRLFSDRLFSRLEGMQDLELYLKSLIINKFNKIGLPKYI